jgi:hypothetical protein
MGIESLEESKLEQELEALYHEVAGEKSSLPQIEGSDTPAGATLPRPSEKPPSQEKKKRKLRFSFIATFAVLSVLLIVLAAVFFWLPVQHYNANNSGEKNYPQRINKPTGKSVLVPPIEDTKQKGKTDLISVSDSKTSKKKYSIQISAYPETDKNAATNFVTDLRKSQPDAYMERVHVPGRGVWYRILLGHFANIDEASTYMKEKNILKAYPGSFVQFTSEGQS